MRPSSDTAHDEFFVGYLPAMPAGHGGLTRWAAGAFAVIGVAVAVLSTTLRRDPGPGTWSHDRAREFIGVLTADPYPMLHGVTVTGLDGPGEASAILVGVGKHGPGLDLQPWAGRPVRITGTSLRRGDLFVVELADGPDAIAEATPGDGAPSPSREIAAQPVTLRGEVIDPKCYAGAMKPGDGKAHRACAARCIAGGIPPVLAVPRAGGESDFYVLAGPGGDVLNQAILPFVGDVVEVSGMPGRIGRARVLLADVDSIRRR